MVIQHTCRYTVEVRVINPWGGKATVVVDPELSHSERAQSFGFARTDVVGDRRYFLLDERYVVCVARGDFELDTVWILNDVSLLAVVGGKGYFFNTDGGVACTLIREFPILGVMAMSETNQLALWTYTDVVLLSAAGVETVLAEVVQDDVSIIVDYPILEISGLRYGLPVRKVFDLTHGEFVGET